MPRDQKPHIGIYGRRNSGKSTLMNLLVGQQVAIVSEIPGTTTDAVKKSIEIPGIGPVILIDTAGIDDRGNLGRQRVAKTMTSISSIDLALLLISHNQFADPEMNLLTELQKHNIPFIVIHNREDEERMTSDTIESINNFRPSEIINHSNLHTNSTSIINAIARHTPSSAFTAPLLLEGIIDCGDIVLLITPIDDSAPEGRLILPQVQTIRNILDNNAIGITVKENEIDTILKNLKTEPKIVITDSQIFRKVAEKIPAHIPLTSFSILMARQKGDFNAYLKGTPMIKELKAGDRILILECCTHHVSCDDIGRIKIPHLIDQYVGHSLSYDIVAATNQTLRPITDYAMVIQCGGCMMTRRQVTARIQSALTNNIPITNYGMAIAYINGIFNRVIDPYKTNNTH